MRLTAARRFEAAADAHAAVIRYGTGLLVALLPALSVAVYFRDFPGLLFGAATLGLLCLLSLVSLATEGLELGPRRITLLALTLAYLLLGTLPAALTAEPDTVIHASRYALALTALILGGADILKRDMELFTLGAAIIGVVLVAFSVAGVVLGSFSFGPLTVTKFAPIVLGNLRIPTTSSLYLQKNYLSTTLVLMLVCLVLMRPRWLAGRVSLRFGLFTWLGLGVVLAGSRSGFAFVSALALGQGIREVHRRGRRGLQAVAAIVVVGLLGLGLFATLAPARWQIVVSRVAHLQDSFVDNFWLKKGWAGRDLLAEAALEAHEARPLGYGFGRVAEAMVLYGSPKETPQSSYLTYLLVGGVPLLALILSAHLAAFVLLLLRWLRLRREEGSLAEARCSEAFLWVVGLLSAEGLVRSLSLGGIGFVPLLLSLAIVLGIAGDEVRRC